MEQHTRFEFKYVMDPNRAQAIHSRLLHFGMKADPRALQIHASGSYPVTSLYFDTPTLEDYADKAGGFLHRKKIRVRIYQPFLTDKTPEIWLEKKEKYEMLVSKKRVLLSEKNYQELLYGPRIDLVKNHPIFLPLMIYGMKPIVAVRYVRYPLIASHQSSLRITFDSNIEACAARDLREIPFMERVTDSTVMEVKFSYTLPHWFRLLLCEFDISRTAFSKYGRSVETIYRYHPVPR
ncbi:MAG: hypothetical protein A3J55_02505 [Candidatus Ryanbacteria bacterium RIFCSPHIGHO2_02_FULL_45_17b]|uniref:VTC domain-containing protein n=1 Tax=Candidatus Ryanbacteria bacterium RIFCSPHIGHO2_01_FULL_45_22 TaxID=1802114 RepID=A0A1G2G096_9BACT|nr:MAG: hypothetical protein A2719_00945 [Candidatus Ryanbacteria bacterium RIFCSPHIGHO2_01_FULL_45_22]OGZ46798.1 MAG: hypothetical protein A3J55_02505 [Candidatus Ryanbacteria bacterium RIFCSPHIGHO2_02_FULL_45_17b]